jgi:hypothetical protein
MTYGGSQLTAGSRGGPPDRRGGFCGTARALDGWEDGGDSAVVVAGGIATTGVSTAVCSAGTLLGVGGSLRGATFAGVAEGS